MPLQLSGFHGFYKRMAPAPGLVTVKSNAPVEVGQATNIVLCMAMDALRAGKRLRWNEAARKVES